MAEIEIMLGERIHMQYEFRAHGGVRARPCEPGEAQARLLGEGWTKRGEKLADGRHIEMWSWLEGR